MLVSNICQSNPLLNYINYIGKSYLGVQIVHALAIVRKYWMQQNNSVGTPPILVLSYKNHATDEFLSDLVNVMGTSLSGNRRFNYGGNVYSGQNVQMVRMGNPGDPNLGKQAELNCKISLR